MKKDRIHNSKRSKLMEIVEESHIGIIEEVDDPEMVGRCKIKVFGVFGDKNDKLGSIPTENLPWAYPIHDTIFGSSSGSGKFSTPKTGSIVRVMFEEDIYHPRYVGIEELDEELKTVIGEDYEGFHSLLYDSDQQVKIYYAKNTGLLLELDESIINIDPTGAILLDHKESSSTIEMKGDTITINTNNEINMSSPNRITVNSDRVHVNGAETDVGANPIFSAVNGEPLFQLLLTLATGLDAKYPNTPGQFTKVVNDLRDSVLSDSVNTTP